MATIRTLLDSNISRTVLAIVAIAVSISIYFLNRKRKALSYEVVRNDELIKVDEGLRNRVEITVDGNPTSGVTLVIIDIQNTGNEPIKKEDFDKPLSFMFEDPAKVISARVLGTKPKDLGAVMNTAQDSVSLCPLLLNKGDAISVEILLTGRTKNVTHSARVVGISEGKGSLSLGRTVLSNGELLSTWLGAGGVGAALIATIPLISPFSTALLIAMGALFGTGLKSTYMKISSRKRI
jgi:hypothetical protein